MVYKARVVQRTVRNGDTQVLRKFAWLPFRINDDMVWLETYEIAQYYQIKIYPIDNDRGFSVGEWKNISYKRIIPKTEITIKEDKK